MARKKADQTRDAAESGEDRSAVLTDDRSDDAPTSAVDADDTVADDVDTDDTDTVADETDADDTVADEDDDTAVADDDLERDDDATAATTTAEPVEYDAEDVDDLDEDDDFDDDDLDDDRGGVGRPAFFATLGVAIVAVLGVLFLLGAFVWPAFLGPGSPEDTANRAVSALGAKDQAQLAEIACVHLDGQPAAAFPPELLALIGNAAPAGPAKQTLDTEARAPIDLTLTQGGQSQTLPADLMFGVSDGDWCLNGISQRQ